jgi:hypothetical protein
MRMLFVIGMNMMNLSNLLQELVQRYQNCEAEVV